MKVEQIQNKVAFWKYEGGIRVRSWWVRHWWPARIKMLELERDDWKRWCEDAEAKLWASQ